MQFNSLLRTSVVVMTFAAPMLVLAQFQKPTDEELKMTADPNYPEAVAVILNREVKFDDVLHSHSEYLRIKILKEKAKELATINVGFFKGDASVDSVEARTIHADGTVIDLNVKPEDLLGEKQGESERRKVIFNLPSVEVGSILEYRYTIHYHQYSTKFFTLVPPDWELQGQYPIRKEHFSYVAPPEFFSNEPGRSNRVMHDSHRNQLTDLLWYIHLPAGKKLEPDAQGHFSLELTDVPPLLNEKWMPPIESQRYQVKFYMTGGTSGAEYWKSAAKEWLGEVDHFAEPTGAIREAAASLVLPGDSELDKARKLYAAVQALDNTNYSRKKSEEELKAEGYKPARRAEDTWTQKSGNATDIALLYLSLLRSVGLQAYPMKVADRRIGFFDQDYLNINQLHGVVIILNSGGQEIVLDPGAKMCPFQMVSWYHSGAGGIREIDKGNGPWITPLLPYAANTVTRRGELTLAADGTVTGKLQFGFTGQDALQWRQQALRVDESELKRRFELWISWQIPTGLEAHLTRFARLDDPSGDLGAYATVSGSLGSSTAKRMMLPGSFFNTVDARTFINQPKRLWPVDVHYAAQFKDGVLYHLPVGYRVESLPQPVPVTWTGKAVLQTKATANGNDVTVTHTLARAFTLLGADEYPQLRDFYQRVAAADQQPLVLTTEPAAPKGN
jgi:transglutaminase-like putative cysteine protease